MRETVLRGMLPAAISQRSTKLSWIWAKTATRSWAKPSSEAYDFREDFPTDFRAAGLMVVTDSFSVCVIVETEAGSGAETPMLFFMTAAGYRLPGRSTLAANVHRLLCLFLLRSGYKDGGFGCRTSAQMMLLVE